MKTLKYQYNPDLSLLLMKESTPLSIAIIPDELVSEQAIKIARKFSEGFSYEFTIDGKLNFPHITLYNALYPSKNIGDLKKILSTIVNQTQPFTLRLTELDIFYSNYIFWMCEKSDQLNKLHLDILSTVNPLREGLVLPDFLTIPNPTDQEQKEISLYGAVMVGNRYTPHLTIMRFEDTEIAKGAIELLNINANINFQVIKIILGSLGKGGTVNEILEIFELKGI